MADTNKVRFGFKNVYYSVITETGGSVSYAEPKEWKGAKSITLDPEGETQTFYADDTAYFTQSTNNGYTGTLEMAYLPDAVLKDVFGHVETQDGLLAEDANVAPKAVALLCEFNGDVKATRHVFYKIVFGRAGLEANTQEDTIEPDVQSIDITCVPVSDSSGHNWTKAKCSSGSSKYNTFFETAPTLPTPKTELNTMSAKSK